MGIERPKKPGAVGNKPRGRSNLQKERPKGRRAPPRSPTYYKDKARSGEYYIEEANGWSYEDRAGSKNPMEPMHSGMQHLVLRDRYREPRFTLRFAETPFHTLEIFSIQRERTAYAPGKDGLYWDAEKETARSKELRERLGNVHPSEFLLAEFLHLNREKIRRGLHVSLHVPVGQAAAYRGLVSRFCTEKPSAAVENDGIECLVYPLNPSRERVKAILGL